MLILAFNCNVCIAQNVDIAFEDFIVEHEGLDNTAGELVPINIDEIERKIRFYIEEKFQKLLRIQTIFSGMLTQHLPAMLKKS